MDPYLLLAAVEGLGPGMLAPLLASDADPEELLRRPPPLPGSARRRLADPNLHHRVRTWIERARAERLAILTPTSEHYPERLRHGPLRPLVLFARGDLAALACTPAVAVVGSRTPTPYGQLAADDFASALAGAGIAIWSGLARGVDGQAHRACLAADTPTVAVLAGGLDSIYPPSHRQLAAQIVAQGGVLLAEAPPGQRPHRGHFPRRNRILAGASAAVLVVEAGLRSGSLHTAAFAAECGTDVFAVPGPYTSPRSAGCHRLIAEGAHLAGDPAELLRALGVTGSATVGDRGALRLQVSGDERALLTVLQSGPRPADLVQREAGLERDHFLKAVHDLTRRDVIRALPGDLLGLARSEVQSPRPDLNR